MMKIRSTSIIAALSFFIPLLCNSQELNDRILLTIAGKEVTAGEFIRMYKNSSEPGKPNDPDQYLQQFINFKLKIADAMNQGIDTTESFRQELRGYRDQLARNYLTDGETKERMLRKAYERSLMEINGWHILINCPEGSKPEDTLFAWQKAAGIRERILGGEPFDKVARETSDDPSVRINGGNLGYFTAFQMISPFEDAAYSLDQDSVSFPVRTPYGYHIIKVTDKRPARGKVLVAHIMKICPPGADENDSKAAAESINNLYLKLQEGQSFSELAKQHSDDKESAPRGGRLNWFGTGEIISEFAEAAFAIKDTGNYSLPVRSPYGWHIIKLLDKQDHGSYEKLRSYFESKLDQSQLSSISRKTFIDKLKKEYNFRVDKSAYDWFVRNTDMLIIKGLRRFDKHTIPSGNIYTFASQQLANSEFASYIETKSSDITSGDPVYFIKELIENMASDQLIKYEDSMLEKKYPDFRFLMNEFHDGILLFDIMGKKIWNKVQEDTAGLQKYYVDNKQNYPGKRAMEATIYTLRSEKGAKSLRYAYRKYSRKPDTGQLMNDRFNNNNDSLLITRQGIWYSGDDPEIDKIEWITGVRSLMLNNYPSLVVIKRVIEPSPLPLEEVRGEVMTDYQEYIENEWTGQLKKQYPVNLDESVFDEIKNNLNHE